MDARREELERKRLKLAELKRAREERKVHMSSPKPARVQQTVDQLVDSLVGPSQQQSQTSKQLDFEPIPPKSQPKLSVQSTQLVEWAPYQRITYDKQIQVEFEQEQQQVQTVDPSLVSVKERVVSTYSTNEGNDSMSAKSPTKQKSSVLQGQSTQMQPKQVRALSDKEMAAVEKSIDFMRFVENSGRIMERALAEDYQVTKDYSQDLQVQGDDDGILVDGQLRRPVKRIKLFNDDSNQAVTDVSFSQTYPELVLTSSALNRSSPFESASNYLVLVWNLHSGNVPEYRFTAQSSVTCVQYSQYHPNLIIGGTDTGQVLQWDTRSHSKAPVLKSPVQTLAHLQRIAGLQQVGNHQAHNLCTMSADGVFCSWQMDMLARPLERISTVDTLQRGEFAAVSTFQFSSGDQSEFLTGMSDGSIYHVNRYDQASRKAGIVSNQQYTGHQGSVTGLHIHHSLGAVDFGNLFLTSSVDWTVKLWRRDQNTSAAVNNNGVHQIQPLMSFEAASDYIYDAKWSPLHPAVFASVDGTGRFDIWNINLNHEIPQQSVQVTDDQSALSRFNWDHAGQKCAVGARNGQVAVYDMGQVGGSVPGKNDYQLLKNKLK